MLDITTELKDLRLHGMASAWTDLTVQETSATATSKWLIEHLLCQSASNTFHLSASNTFHFFSPLMLAFALLESIRIIPCFQDVAVMRDAIQ